MNISRFDLIGVGLYFVLIGIFGYLTRRTKTFSEFAVGGHKVPATMVFASLAATIVGPGFSIGFTSRGWSSGFLYYYLALAYGVQVIIVGLIFAPRLSTYRDCHSLGDIMRKKYGEFTRLLTGIISVAICIGFTAVMGKIGGGMLHLVTGWPLGICLVVVTSATALLTFTGGVRATIATEGLQFALKASVIPLTLLLAFKAGPLTAHQVAEKASELTAQGVSQMTGLQMAGIAISFLLGETLIPPYANRALAATSGTASKQGFLLAGGFCMVWLAVVSVFGVVGHGLLGPGVAPDDVFLTLGRIVLPDGLFGLLLAAIIAIVMSSQESVLNSSAVAFLRDVVEVFKPLSDESILLWAKVSTMLIAAISIVFAYFSPSIIDGLLIVYSIWAPTILVPLLLGLYLKETRPAAGWSSILIGGTASLLWHFALGEPRHIPSILVGLAGSGMAYALAHVLSAPRSVGTAVHGGTQ